MLIANSIITICWFVFILYWGFSAIGVKKDVRKSGWRGSWLPGLLARIVVLIGVIGLIDWLVAPNSDPRGVLFGMYASSLLAPLFSGNLVVDTIGVILTIGGIAFAIWARRHLGRNWSGRPMMKENHELVTSGPYRFVRHPIYTGMIAAILGSALVGGPIWLIFWIAAFIIFLLRIPKEEGYMMQLFPDQYPAYRARTKALIPFVW